MKYILDKSKIPNVEGKERRGRGGKESGEMQEIERINVWEED